MLNILIIHPVYPGKVEIVYLPLGLGYIAAIAEQLGHRVQVLDMHNLRLPQSALEDELRRGDYDICLMGGFAMQVAHMRHATETVRRLSPRTKVVLGGVGVSDIPEIILDYTGADAVAIGECEATLGQMFESVLANAAFEGVPTFVYRSPSGLIVKNPKGPLVEDLDTIPMPAYHLFDVDYISQHSYNGEGFRSIHVLSSRGCPFRCSFCINSILNDNKFLRGLHGEVIGERKAAKQRFRSPQNLVAELTFLRDTYGITDFHFADEEFVTNRERVFEVCSAIEPLGITWSTSGRADWASEDKLTAMRAAGCRYVLLGVETGSQKMMDMMHKSGRKEKMADGIRSARASGMHFIANFMVGHPGETQETIAETIEFCRELELTFLPTYTTVFPNSKMFHDFAATVKDWGAYFEQLSTVDFTSGPFTNLTDMPDRELIGLRNRAVTETVAYKLVGKDRRFLAKLLALLLLRPALIAHDHSPGWLRWLVRSALRQVIDLSSRKGGAIQIPPNQLGQGVSTPMGEDSFEESLRLLEEETDEASSSRQVS